MTLPCPVQQLLGIAGDTNRFLADERLAAPDRMAALLVIGGIQAIGPSRKNGYGSPSRS